MSANLSQCSDKFDRQPHSSFRTQKLQHDLYYADALERFWLLHLKHMNAGKPCVCFQGWDEQGRAILDTPSMENEEFKKVVIQSVGACEIDKMKEQEQIRKLSAKTP